MKTVTFLLSLLLIGSLTYASIPDGSIESLNRKVYKTQLTTNYNSTKLQCPTNMLRNFNCTVTITASMGYSSTYLLASCSSTKTTCNAAISEASSCVKSALDAAKKNMK